MRRIRIIFFLSFCLLLPASSWAQNVTTVSATVVDPNGIPYSFASVSAQLIPTGVTPTINGQAVSGFARSSADVTGTFSMNLASNAVLSPGGTQWQFTVNENGIPAPFGTGPQSIVVAITISGASQSITATLNAAALKLTNFSGAGTIGGAIANQQIAFGSGPNAITGDGSFTYNVVSHTAILQALTAAAPNGSANVNSPSSQWCANYGTGAASAQVCATIQLLVGAGVNPVTTWSFSNSGAPNAFQVNLSGNLTVFGSAIVSSMLSNSGSIDGQVATLTSAGNASGGTTTYLGPFNTPPVPPVAGMYLTIAGFTNGVNNGRFIVQSSNATQVVVFNAAGVAETHAATATLDNPYNNLQGNWILRGNGIGSTFNIAGTTYSVNQVISSTPNQIDLENSVEGNTTDAGYERNINNGATGDHGREIGTITDGTGTNPTYLRMGNFGGVTAVYSVEAGGSLFRLAQVIKATSAAFATATTAGTCVQSTTAVTGATTSMAVSVSPASTPGVGAVWSAFVSSAGNVTINECAVATSAGGSIAFNIRVTP